MKCPKCNEKTVVLETRNVGQKIIRRRMCKKCRENFVTVEDFMGWNPEARTLLKEGRDNVVRIRDSQSS